MVETVGLECGNEFVACVPSLHRSGHPFRPLDSAFRGFDHPAVTRVAVYLADRLRAHACEYTVTVFRLEGAGLPGNGEEGRRFGPLEEAECLRLILACIGDEGAGRVHYPCAEHVVVHPLRFGEHTNEEQAVDACSRGRNDVVRCALLVALGIREIGVVELCSEDPISDLAATWA